MKIIFKTFLYLLISGSAILSCNGRTLQNQQNNLLQARTIGGQVVAAGALPFQVAIQSTFGEIICGGSIISSRWILTAAHCANMPKEYLKVITGTTKWKEPGAEYLVQEKFIHCSYNKPWMQHDIALLYTNKPIEFNKVTQPIQLAKNNTLKIGDKLTLSGWGSTKVWGRPSDKLHSVEVNYMPHDECSKTVKKASWLGETNICTDTTSGNGSCMTDSGGPLVFQNKYLFGVINWGEACAVGRPDVHASVASYFNWITNIKEGGKAC